MNPMWTALTYLTDRIRARTRAALDGNPESGALSLEWIAIAVLLVAAATFASVYFKNAITAESGQLP
ncbi:MAG TPA: hypothetical protein VGG25_17360 [Streptosporangiaceae bacterium]|jgi:hypothetical protein